MSLIVVLQKETKKFWMQYLFHKFNDENSDEFDVKF